MKTVAELRDEVLSDYSANADTYENLPESALDGYTVIFHKYDQGDYEGCSFTLLSKSDGTLFEVNSNHCSCNGLGWYEPESTSVEDLLFRIEKGHLGQYHYGDDWSSELKTTLEGL